MIWLLAIAIAQAGHWKDPRWYVDPILNGGAVSVNGVTYAQASGGLQGGFRSRYKGSDIPWMNHTRARGIGTYGITSGSLGADFRVGSFFGPAWKRVVLQHGPDLWYSGYGSTASPDYRLNWSPGIDLFNGIRVKVAKGLFLNGEVVPAWAFAPARRGGGLWIFDEFRTGASVTARVSKLSLTVGYTHRWNAAGEQGFVVLGAGISI